jgi:hypothetical protein
MVPDIPHDEHIFPEKETYNKQKNDQNEQVNDGKMSFRFQDDWQQ